MAKPNSTKLLLIIWLVSASGCANLAEPGQTTTWLKSKGPGVAERIVQLDVAIVERPMGDPFLNRELWQSTDELIIDLDRKASLEENGFRVGQIVGMAPGRLLELLKSERYCSNPRQSLFPSGHSVQKFLSPVWTHCDFEVRLGKEICSESFDQARFCLDVKATLTNDNKTRLSFTPKVENGETTLPFYPDPTQNTWVMSAAKACKTYPDLAWEVVLAPGEFLVIGAVLGKEKSLGHRSFVQDEGNPVQRLLVLRTNRAPPGGESSEPNLEDIARNHLSPCLAAQASMMQVRARGE